MWCLPRVCLWGTCKKEADLTSVIVEVISSFYTPWNMFMFNTSSVISSIRLKSLCVLCGTERAYNSAEDTCLPPGKPHLCGTWSGAVCVWCWHVDNPHYLSVLTERPLASIWSSAGYRAVSLELQLGQNLCCCGLPWGPASSHGVKHGVKAAEKRSDSPGSWLKSQRRVTSTRVQTEGWAGLGRAIERLWV